MAGDPTLQINPNKAVPAPDNILHQYTNYTYKISLLSFKSIQTYNDIIEKANWNNMHGLAPVSCYTLFSSGGILNSGSEFLPARHPLFELDFYVGEVQMTGIMGQNRTTRATNLMEFQMSVIEPVGTTLLDRFYELLSADGASWNEKPMLLQIDFLGYDEAGKPERIKAATRWVPCKLRMLNFVVAGEGTTYSLDFVAWAMADVVSNPLYNSLQPHTISGKTLTDFCTFLEDKFNKEQETKSTTMYGDFGDVVTARTQEYPDIIKFKIGRGKTPADAALKAAKISPNVAKQTRLKVVPEGTATAPGEKGRESPPEKFKYNSSIRYYGDGENTENKVEVIGNGQTYLSVLEKLIRDSTYITDQLEDPLTKGGSASLASKKKSVLKDPEKGLNWWKFTYIKKLGNFDKIRNVYARELTVQIDAYKVADPDVTGASNAKPGTNGIPSVARSYEYLYTGQNLDVVNLNLSFDNAFMQTLSRLSTENYTAENPNQQPNEQTVVANPDAGNQLTGESSLGTGSTSKSHAADSFLADTHANPKQQMSGTLMENLYRQVGADNIKISLEIIGDPGYIQQDGILTMNTELKTGAGGNTSGFDPANGCILSDLADSHFYLVFKTPRDVNEATGLADFSGSYGGSMLSGYFRIMQIQHVFSGGQFSQVIQATRIFNQFRENLNNSEQDVTDLMSADETAIYNVEDLRGPPGNLTAPGSASAAAVNSEFEGLGAPKPWEIDAGEFAGTPLPVREELKANALALEIADAQVEDRGFAGLETQTSTNRNFVNPHADFNTAALQGRPQTAAEFRAAEARTFQITTSVAQNTVASNISASVSPGLEVGRPNPAEASGGFTLSASPARESYRSTPSFLTTTGGTALSTPQGNPHGTVGTTPIVNTSSYNTTDQTTVANNDIIQNDRANTIINAGAIAAGAVGIGIAIAKATPVGRIITAALTATQIATAWAEGNSASEENEVIHGKYGNEVPSWEKRGYLLDIISKKDSTTTGGGGGF